MSSTLADLDTALKLHHKNVHSIVLCALAEHFSWNDGDLIRKHRLPPATYVLAATLAERTFLSLGRVRKAIRDFRSWGVFRDATAADLERFRLTGCGKHLKRLPGIVLCAPSFWELPNVPRKLGNKTLAGVEDLYLDLREARRSRR
jgi:hypothetical protein